MRRVNLYAYFDMGAKLRSAIKALTPGESRWEAIFRTDVVLDSLLKDPIFDGLPSSRKHGSRLSEKLGVARRKGDPFDNEIASAEDIEEIKAAYSTFEAQFAEELTRANVYAVDRKGIYETDALINRASETIPSWLIVKLPQECKSDLEQAGRCLAFELPTAAAFHIMRAVESAMWTYWIKLTKKSKPNNRNWGSALKSLEDSGADAKVVAALTQLKDLHRNPVMHPEETLDMDEAMALWMGAQGTIIAIARELA